MSHYRKTDRVYGPARDRRVFEYLVARTDDTLCEMFEVLTPIQRRVLATHYRLDEKRPRHRPHSVPETAAALGMTRGRVSHHIGEGLQKWRRWIGDDAGPRELVVRGPRHPAGKAPADPPRPQDPPADPPGQVKPRPAPDPPPAASPLPSVAVAQAAGNPLNRSVMRLALVVKDVAIHAEELARNYRGLRAGLEAVALAIGDKVLDRAVREIFGPGGK